MDQNLILGLILGLALLVVVGLVAFRGRSKTKTRPGSINQDLKSVEVSEQHPIESPVVDSPVADVDVSIVTKPAGVPIVGVAETSNSVPTQEDQSQKFRERIAKSQSLIGDSFRSLFSSNTISSTAWTDLEDALILSDVGAKNSVEIVDKLKGAIKKSGSSDPAALKEIAKQELSKLVQGNFDRTIKAERKNNQPAVILTVGVNGTGKTTTTGKLAKLLATKDLDVLLGAADTFRAAAAEQLITWGDRIGVPVVRGAEGSDPASVAFEAVKTGTENEVDVVLIDTAGRLHTKQGLMDELGKVHRVIEKTVNVDEVLLVIDATTGQNGLTQAKVFAEVVPLTGIVLTKLDGTAKGGIVIAVQQELGVPVKFVGLGEGPDDLAEFDPELFVTGLIN